MTNYNVCYNVDMTLLLSNHNNVVIKACDDI